MKYLILKVLKQELNMVKIIVLINTAIVTVIIFLLCPAILWLGIGFKNLGRCPIIYNIDIGVWFVMKGLAGILDGILILLIIICKLYECTKGDYIPYKVGILKSILKTFILTICFLDVLWCLLGITKVIADYNCFTYKLCISIIGTGLFGIIKNLIGILSIIGGAEMT